MKEASARIKLFLHSGKARRVLFLVDRLKLEDQTLKAFKKALSNDHKAVIYKENRDDWRHAEIVVTTVQSLLFNNKYQRLFSPTDFDLVISDEAHRSIGGNGRKKPPSEIGEGQEPIVMPKAVYLRKMAGFGMPPAKSTRLLNFEQLYIKNQSAIRSNRSTCPTRSVSQI